MYVAYFSWIHTWIYCFECMKLHFFNIFMCYKLFEVNLFWKLKNSFDIHLLPYLYLLKLILNCILNKFFHLQGILAGSYFIKTIYNPFIFKFNSECDFFVLPSVFLGCLVAWLCTWLTSCCFLLTYLATLTPCLGQAVLVT